MPLDLKTKCPYQKQINAAIVEHITPKEPFEVMCISIPGSGPYPNLEHIGAAFEAGWRKADERWKPLVRVLEHIKILGDAEWKKERLHSVILDIEKLLKEVKDGQAISKV
jgi:hypothetical protein